MALEEVAAGHADVFDNGFRTSIKRQARPAFAEVVVAEEAFHSSNAVHSAQAAFG